MRFVVREAAPSDADALGRIHVRAWQAAYSGGLMPDRYLAELSVTDRAATWRRALGSDPRPRATRLVAATSDGWVLGFALVGPAGTGTDTDTGTGTGTGELHAINVDPDAWGRGVGACLIDAALTRLADAGFTDAVLWVHPDNARARRFYEDRGWSADHVDRNQDVLGVDVPETRYSIRISEPQ